MANETEDLRDGFRFRGDHPALDLTATVTGRLKAAPREMLTVPGDLDRWIAAAGFDGAVGTADRHDLERARALREAIYTLATDPNDAARATLNRVAADVPATLSLADNGRSVLRGPPAALLASVARDAILLFGGDLADRVRQCGGDGCAILFVDRSRKGDRRWCAMAACGNKAKAASFRNRARQG